MQAKNWAVAGALLILSASVSGGVVNPEWVPVFSDDFAGTPVPLDGDSNMDAGLTSDWEFINPEIIKRTGSGQVRIKSSSGTRGMKTKNRFAASNSTEFYLGGMDTDKSGTFFTPLRLVGDGVEYQVWYRFNDKRLRVSVKNGDDLFDGYSTSTESNPDISLLADSTSLNLYFGGEQVDLNGDDQGLSYTHGLSSVQIDEGFEVRLWSSADSGAMNTYFDQVTIATVPEPASTTILLIGTIGVILTKKKQL